MTQAAEPTIFLIHVLTAGRAGVAAKPRQCSEFKSTSEIVKTANFCNQLQSVATWVVYSHHNVVLDPFCSGFSPR